MRLVKATLAGLLVVALGTMWMNRGWVVDAYQSDEMAAPVRLSGVDLAVEIAEIEPSPYRISSAPDTRTGPRDVAFGIHSVTASVAELPPTLTGGDARLQGTVVGPDGPVPQAIVRIERHTDGGTVTLDLTTGDDGRWVAGPLAGGRYRVRAWLPGSMTMGRSEVRFVADDEVATFDFSLWGVDATPRFELVDGGPMYEGLPATVAVVLGWRSVDLEGLVVTNPVVGAGVTVETTAQVQVLSPQPLTTNGDGVAWVQLRCVPTGIETPVSGSGGTLVARSGSTSASFALPGCVVPPPPPAAEPDTEPDTDAETDTDTSTDDGGAADA